MNAVSDLVFTARLEDHNKVLECRAVKTEENLKIRREVVTITLDVYCEYAVLHACTYHIVLMDKMTRPSLFITMYNYRYIRDNSF